MDQQTTPTPGLARQAIGQLANRLPPAGGFYTAGLSRTSDLSFSVIPANRGVA